MFQVLVGVVAMCPEPWALEENYSRFEGYVREAARPGAPQVVGPESLVDGYVCGADPETTRERMVTVAQTVPDGPYLRRAAALSRELGIHLVLGFLEREGEELYNACAMFGPAGELVGRYRKVHPTNEFGITPGQELKPFATPFGRTALLICNDASIAENFSALSAQQVDLILIPTNGGPRTMVNFILRAVDTGCFIVVANTASCGIVGPTGTVYLEQRETECVYVQRLDLFELPRRREGGSHPFHGRRPDLYGSITTTFEEGALFDAQGRPTELELKRRQEWLAWLRQQTRG
jgi:predicted amidohydrolase